MKKRLVRGRFFQLGMLLASIAIGACGTEPVAKMQLAPIQGEDGSHRRLQFELNGQPREYELTADDDVIAEDATIIIQSGDNVEVQDLKLRVYSTRSGKDRIAVVADENDKVRRAIVSSDNEVYEIMTEAGSDHYVTLRDSEQPLPEGKCGVESHHEGAHLSVLDIPAGGTYPAKWGSCSPADKAPVRSNIGIAMDFGEFKRLGGTMAAAQDHVAAIVLRANGAYFYQMGVVLTLKTLMIQSATGGPAWNSDPATKSCPTINDNLNTFSSWYANNVAGKAGMAQGPWQLLTACYASGTVGLAWIGTLCNRSYATGIVGSSDRSMWYTFAHELGHNFGGQHTFGQGGIMDYGDGLVNGVMQFASANQPQMCSHLTATIPNGLTRGCFESYQPTDNNDTTPPSSPSSFSASLVTGGVALKWQASTDNVSVANYAIYRNGAKIATTANVSYTDTTVAAGTTYSYHATAADAVGNVSTASNSISITTPASPTHPGDNLSVKVVTDQPAYERGPTLYYANLTVTTSINTTPVPNVPLVGTLTWPDGHSQSLNSSTDSNGRRVFRQDIQASTPVGTYTFSVKATYNGATVTNMVTFVVKDPAANLGVIASSDKPIYQRTRSAYKAILTVKTSLGGALLPNVSVVGTITQPNGKTVSLTGTTNSAGEKQFLQAIKRRSKAGTYKLTVTATHNGATATHSTTFLVK